MVTYLTPRHGGQSSALQRVAADAAAEISAEAAMVIAGSNEDLVS